MWVLEEDVIKLFAEGNCMVLKYRGLGSQTKHLIQCPNGHQYEVCFSNFKLGHRCRICGGLEPITEEVVRNLINK